MGLFRVYAVLIGALVRLSIAGVGVSFVGVTVWERGGAHVVGEVYRFLVVYVGVRV